MKTLLIALALLASVVQPMQARLGETKAQIQTRYGKPLDIAASKYDGAPILNQDTLTSGTTGFSKQAYSLNGVNIKVLFIDGKSSMEEYSKANTEAFADEEITILLSVNSAGHAWESDYHTDGDTASLLTTGGQPVFWSNGINAFNILAVAACNESHTVLTIVDHKCIWRIRDWMTNQQDKKSSPQPENFEGF